MQLIKCPRCDLNYIREDEKYCKVCLRELKGEKNTEEVELCSICNEEPALPGRDVCIFAGEQPREPNNGLIQPTPPDRRRSDYRRNE